MSVSHFTTSSTSTYKKLGEAGIKGSLYQIKLLTLVFLRAIKNGLPFQLATEMVEAGKFDDLVLFYTTPGGRDESLLIQLKHFQDADKNIITIDRLFSGERGNFNLLKYYKSYKENIEGGPIQNIKELVIFTNADLIKTLTDNTKGLVEAVNKTKENILHFDKKHSGNQHYRLTNKIVDELNVKLNNELIKLPSIFLGKIIEKQFAKFQKDDLYRKYENILMQEILRVNNFNNITLYEDFINGDASLSRCAKIFRCHLIDALDCKKNDLNTYIQSELNCLYKIEGRTDSEEYKIDCLCQIKGGNSYDLLSFNILLEHIKLTVSAKYAPNKRVSWPQDEVNADEWECFFKYLVLAVKQPDELQLEEYIKEEIEQMLHWENLPVNIIYNHLQNEMTNWFKMKIGDEDNKGYLLSADDGQHILNKVKLDIDILVKLKGHSNEYCENLSQFRMNSAHNLNLLKSISGSVIHIVSAYDIFYSMIKIYQILFDARHNYLFIKIKFLQNKNAKNLILNALKNDSYNGVIFECLSSEFRRGRSEMDALTDIVETFYTLNVNKNIILVSMESDDDFVKLGQAIEDTTQPYTKIKDDSNINDINEQLLEHILSKKILLQGKTLELNEVISKDSIDCFDSETLIKLTSKDELSVGIMPLCLKDLNSAYLKLYEKVHIPNLSNMLLKYVPDTLFLFSGFKEYNIEAITQQLIDILEINQVDEEYFKLQLTLLDSSHHNDVNKIIKIIPNENQEKYFKNICLCNPDSIVYWLEMTSTSQFYLQMVYNSRFYCKRKLNSLYEGIVNENFVIMLKESNKHDHFVFSGVSDKKVLCNFLDKYKTDGTLDVIDEKFKNNTIHISELGAEEIFRRICAENNVVHWFHVRCDRMIWKCSQGSLKDLKKCIDQKKKSHFENEFIKATNMPCVILSDEPGMGKSTALASITQQMLSSHWIIALSFKDCVGAICQLPDVGGLNMETVITFLSTVEHLGLKDNFARRLLRFTLEGKTFVPLLMLFDGFDEISVDCQNRVLNLMQFLKKCSNTSLWITTRPNVCEKLENALSTFAVRFEELCDSEQVNYLKTFWSIHIPLVTDERSEMDTKILRFAEILHSKCIRHFLGNSNFLGVPLLLRLLSEGFLVEVVNFINNKEEESALSEITSSSINELDIFRRFVKIRCDIYLKEKINVSKKYFTEDNYIEESVWRYFIKDHQDLALYNLFPHSKYTQSMTSERLYQKLLRTNKFGIVYGDENHPMQFYHKTFSEYFVATMLYYKIQKTNSMGYKDSLEFMQNEILIKPSSYMIRRFLDSMLVEGQPLLCAALEGNTKGVIEQIVNGSSILNEDSLGRTVLHIAALRGDYKTMELILCCSKGASLVTKTDNLGNTPLHYSCMDIKSSVVDLLLNDICDVDINDHVLRRPFSSDTDIGNSFLGQKYANSNLVKLVNLRNNFGDTCLHFACKYDSLIAAKLISVGANCKYLRDTDKIFLLNQKNFIDSNKSLYLFVMTRLPYKLLKHFVNRRTKRLIFLLKCKLNMPSLVENAFCNIFDRCRLFDSIGNIMRYDVEHLALVSHVKKTKSCLEDYMLRALVKCHIKTFKYLVDRYERHYKCQKTNQFLLVLFAKAISTNNMEAVKYLGEIYGTSMCYTDGNTLLHIAAENGSLQSIKYFIERGINVYSTNKCNETPLDVAIAVKQHGSMDYLNIVDAKLGFKTEEKLLRHNSELNKQKLQKLHMKDYISKTHYTELLKAVTYGDSERVNYLLNLANENVDVRDERQQTLLHLAASGNNKEIVQHLMAHGATYNAKNADGKTPSDLARDKGVFDVADNMFKEICSNGYQATVYCISMFQSPLGLAIIKTRDSLGNTLLHYASAQGCLVRVYYILNIFRTKHKFSKNNVEGDTALHLAAKGNHKHVVQYLMECGAPYNLKNARGKTPLDLMNDSQLLQITEDLFAQMRAIDFDSVVKSLTVLPMEYGRAVTNTRDKKGNTLLHYAAREGHLDIACLLLKHGASYDRVNDSNRTSENIASSSKVKFLLKIIRSLFCKKTYLYSFIPDLEDYCVADIEMLPECEEFILSARNSFGETLLHSTNDLFFIKYLLNNNVDVNTRNNIGATPLQVAVNLGNIQKTTLLLRHGAKTDLYDYFGRPVLCHVSMVNDLRMIWSGNEFDGCLDCSKKGPLGPPH